MSAEWFAQVKAFPVADVAARLGLTVYRRGNDVSFPCPVCGKAVRHSKGLTDGAKERAPKAAKVTPEGLGWWCEPCGARGDAVNLASQVVSGTTKPSTPETWAMVRRECAALGLCEADPRDSHPVTAMRYVAPAPLPRSPEAMPSRLPAAEVAALWAACSRLDAVPSWDSGDWCGLARVYLSGRALDVSRLASLDAARILPPSERYTWPAWWPSTWSKVWRVAVPLFDATGAMVAIQARAIEEANPKTRNPMGSGVVTGTFFADTRGLEVLRGTFTGKQVTIVEGLPDFLTAAQLAQDAAEPPAVLGIVSGSPKALALLRTTTLCRFVAIVHGDEAGERYFQQVREALPRHSVGRVTLQETEANQ